MLIHFSICINLLKETTSNSKLKYIGFYINLLKRVEIDKNKRLSKGSFKFLKTLFGIRSPLIGSSFSAILYANLEIYKAICYMRVLVNKIVVKICKFKKHLHIIKRF